MPEPLDDADDLRSTELRRLLRKRLTWALVGGLALAALAGGALVNVVLGLIAAPAVLLVGLVVVFVIADSKAADAFFEVYADQHDYALGDRGSLPAATPLLRKGDSRYAERTLTGTLGPGVDGLLALYTYTETTYNGKTQQTNYYHYTLGLTDVPECVEHVPELYCQRKLGFRALEGFEDLFRDSKQRVELESGALLDKYEIFTAKSQDANWMRRLFSPSFIVWLTDSAPPKFAFELVGGTLCCYVGGHAEGAADLDALAAATTTVATRLREESGETATAASSDPDTRG
jgi:hypothetical protein